MTNLRSIYMYYHLLNTTFYKYNDFSIFLSSKLSPSAYFKYEKSAPKTDGNAISNFSGVFYHIIWESPSKDLHNQKKFCFFKTLLYWPCMHKIPFWLLRSLKPKIQLFTKRLNDNWSLSLNLLNKQNSVSPR